MAAIEKNNKQYSVPKLKKIATSIPLRSTDAGQKEERNRTGNPSLVNCTCRKEDQIRRLLLFSYRMKAKESPYYLSKEAFKDKRIKRRQSSQCILCREVCLLFTFVAPLARNL